MPACVLDFRSAGPKRPHKQKAPHTTISGSPLLSGPRTTVSDAHAPVVMVSWVLMMSFAVEKTHLHLELYCDLYRYNETSFMTLLPSARLLLCCIRSAASAGIKACTSLQMIRCQCY